MNDVTHVNAIGNLLNKFEVLKTMDRSHHDYKELLFEVISSYWLLYSEIAISCIPSPKAMKEIYDELSKSIKSSGEHSRCHWRLNREKAKRKIENASNNIRG